MQKEFHCDLITNILRGSHYLKQHKNVRTIWLRRIEPIGIHYPVIIRAAEHKYGSDERKCAGQMQWVVPNCHNWKIMLCLSREEEISRRFLNVKYQNETKAFEMKQLPQSNDFILSCNLGKQDVKSNPLKMLIKKCTRPIGRKLRRLE